MENNLSFFFRHQIWHVGVTIVLFYIGSQLVNLDSNTNTFLGISALSWFMIAMAIHWFIRFIPGFVGDQNYVGSQLVVQLGLKDI